MRPIRISEDFVPVSEFKAHAAELLNKLSEKNAPIIVTQNGKPAGVLLSPQAFDELSEQTRLIDAVNEGLADVEAGRVHSQSEVIKQIKSWYGSKKKTGKSSARDLKQKVIGTISSSRKVR